MIPSNIAELKKMELHILPNPQNPQIVQKIVLKSVKVVRTPDSVWLVSNPRLIKLKREGKGVAVYEIKDFLGFVAPSEDYPKLPKLPNFINCLLGIKRWDEPKRL
jgi:hypothetical protein